MLLSVDSLGGAGVGTEAEEEERAAAAAVTTRGSRRSDAGSSAESQCSLVLLVPADENRRFRWQRGDSVSIPSS